MALNDAALNDGGPLTMQPLNDGILNDGGALTMLNDEPGLTASQRWILNDQRCNP